MPVEVMSRSMSGVLAATLGTGERTRSRRTLMDSYKTTIQSAPCIGFGTGSRPALMEPGDSPGPGAYVIKSTLYKNPSSALRSPPSFSMRGREKFGSPNLKSVDPTLKNEPGPGHYKLPKRHMASPYPPEYTFPKDPGPWAASGRVNMSPGPGQYTITSAVGTQVLSTKRSCSKFGFGTGERPELIQVSTADVGPGDYKTVGGCGEKQMDSRKKNLSTVRFGHSARKAKGQKGAKTVPLEDDDAVPGPGSYELPSWQSNGAGNPYTKAPRTYIAGRVKFGSPFS